MHHHLYTVLVTIHIPILITSAVKVDTGFVGLVNQAMTCYLNSLLQTLYMTPEFRNALYRWEFDATEEEEMTSIPFQLQKLFIQMQTSKKKSVETTEVTKSFGWDSSEAWQQHDVQELCRVMFDALETKFKNTEQSDLINQLYQGKMKDYVKCLECGYESARTDSFLDIPLTIRPFGSTQSFLSVGQALHAFVQPETLEGSNQYFCEKCNKKCDAHKGLKFLKFPYLLTLQLKRFDFDYTTMHRIKLNDQMTFPEIIDLSHFITDDIKNKVDADSNTDSGAENEDSSHSNNSSDCQQDGVDEGIDIKSTNSEMANEQSSASSEMANGQSSASSEMANGQNSSSSEMANEKQSASSEKTNEQSKSQQDKGPSYELFSIMVHSGSAAGGHYYAYIKSFTDGQWYCFNDQHVTTITQDDIRKTYGGSVSGYRGYYSSAYSSSTNAYMLMYRQVQPDKNKAFIKESDFPPHIVSLVEDLKQQEEIEKRQRELDRNTCKIKLFGFNSDKNKTLERKLEVHKDKTLKEATELAHKLLELDDVPLELCRLIKYDEFHDSLEKSFEGEEDTTMGVLLGGVKSTYSFDLLLETRRAEQTFQVYKPGGVTVKVYEVDILADIIHPPITVRAHLEQTVQEFKQLLAQVTGKNNEMRVILERYYNDLRMLTVPNKTLKGEGFFRSNKVFIECEDIEDALLPLLESRLYEIIDRHAHTIRVFISLPHTVPDVDDSDAMQVMSEEHAVNIAQDHHRPDSITRERPDTIKDILQSNDDITTDVVRSVADKLSQLNSGSTDRTIRDDGTDQSAGENCSNNGTDTVETASVSDSDHNNQNNVESTLATVDKAVLNKENVASGDHNSSTITGASTRSSAACTQDAIHGEELMFSDPLKVTEQCKIMHSVDDTAACKQRGIDSMQEISTRARSASAPVQTAKYSDSEINSEVSSVCDNCNKVALPVQEVQLCASGKETLSNTVVDNTEAKEKRNVKSKKKSYIKIEKYKHDDSVLMVCLDKRVSLGILKKSLEPYVGVASPDFKVYRVYPNNQEFECVRLNENLTSYGDDSKIAVRLGRALKKGEYRVKVYQLLVNDPEPCKLLFEWIFAKGMTVLESKQQIIEEMNRMYDTDTPVERCRMRKKTWKNPGTIFLNDQIYEDDIPIYSNWEIFVEILPEPEKMMSMAQLSLFSKRWRPSDLSLDSFQEIILENSTVEELKKRLSEVSGLDPEVIEFAKGRGTFPCEVPILDMQTELEWEPPVLLLNVNPLYISDDGQVIYYRDNREELKEISDEEKKSIQKKENAKWVNSTQRVTYSPKKERALKIYTDSSPPTPKNED
ncbi:ubiquitin carboxyl-terminal hydrolase 47-like [Saccoglossus kowalevskii]